MHCHALPAEDHQIRRGGNGQIFAANYAGYTLVAKKTHFRNREYNIITPPRPGNEASGDCTHHLLVSAQVIAEQFTTNH